MKNKIKVSVLCPVYNHEKYLRQTLDSILMQKTNFKYEVIIRDDASTDNTTEIIKEYQKKYPDIIKPIYEKKNKHNKNDRLFMQMIKYAKGKYTAAIEGDDYWIDPYKLQKQYDFMENNPEYGLVVTNYKIYNDKTKKTKKSHLKSKDYSIEEIIIGDGGMFATSSLFTRVELLNLIDSFYYLSPFEDYVSVLNYALRSQVHLIKDYTCVYRINAINSWTTMLKEKNESKTRKYLYNEMKAMFEEFNRNTDNEYIKYTEYLLLTKEFIIHVLDKDIKMMKDRKFKLLYKMGSLKSRFIYFNKIHFSKTYIYLRNIKHKIEKY